MAVYFLDKTFLVKMYCFTALAALTAVQSHHGMAGRRPHPWEARSWGNERHPRSDDTRTRPLFRPCQKRPLPAFAPDPATRHAGGIRLARAARRASWDLCDRARKIANRLHDGKRRSA